MRYVSAAELEPVEIAVVEARKLAAAASFPVTLEWFGKVVRVHFSDAESAALFARRYAAFRSVNPSSADLTIFSGADERGRPLIVTDRRSGWRHPDAVGGAVVLSFLTDAIVQHAYFDVNPQLQSFHAAALCCDGKALAISAVSTGGKSTTALACVKQGMGLYSDERCVVAGRDVLPFPRAINVRSGGIELLLGDGDMARSDMGERLAMRRGTDWECVAFGELLGERMPPASAPLEAIFFIVGFGESAVSCRLDRGDSVKKLIEAGYCGPAPGMGRVAAAMELVKQTACYALTLGTPMATARHLADRVTGGKVAALSMS